MRLDTGEGVLSLTIPVHAEQDRLPGDPGVWLFITADVFVFGLFFLLFSLGRVAQPALYERSRLVLSPTLGLVNTLILLTSSWFMVRAVSAAREGARRRVRRNLALAMAVGSVFAVTKIIEYTAKIQAGITMLSNEFFTYYFVFTGVHFLHFIIGMVVLMTCFYKAKTQPIGGKYVIWIESSGCYWHMVDLLWVVLFPMLYLLRAT
jgi:nitric oxide reductase NorE protein